MVKERRKLNMQLAKVGAFLRRCVAAADKMAAAAEEVISNGAETQPGKYSTRPEQPSRRYCQCSCCIIPSCLTGVGRDSRHLNSHLLLR